MHPKLQLLTQVRERSSLWVLLYFMIGKLVTLVLFVYMFTHTAKKSQAHYSWLHDISVMKTHVWLLLES